MSQNGSGQTNSGISGGFLISQSTAPPPTNLPGTGRASLRRHYRQARRSLTPRERAQRTHAIVCHAMSGLALLKARRIAAFAAADGEPDLSALLLRLHQMGKTLALPVVAARGQMSFYRHQPGEQGATNRYGILEPALDAAAIDTRSIQVVLTPMVAFDRHGNRLGMGAGYYDRHFAPLPRRLRPRLVGIAYDLQHADDLCAEPWDVALDAVVTESGWQQFPAAAGGRD